MRVLVLDNRAKGIINLQEHEYFVFDNISEFGQVLRNLAEAQKSHFDYKYCVLEEGQFIPFFIKIRTKLKNQMEEFEFDRVKFNELTIAEETKEKIITEMVSKNNLLAIEEMEKRAIKLIVKKEFGNDVSKDLEKVGEEIEKLEKEIKNIDYKNYLNEFV